MAKKAKKVSSDGFIMKPIKGTPPARTGRTGSQYDELVVKVKELAPDWVHVYEAPENGNPRAAHARRMCFIRAAERLGLKEKFSAQVREKDGKSGLWAIYG